MNMTIILDDFKKIAEVDKEKMADKLEEMPQQYRKAWEKAIKIKLPENYQDINQIVICGMGGSAIGGDLVKDFSKIPVFVSRDYNLPDFVGPKTLIILISYSGETEEVLNCLKGMKSKKIFIITSGGELEKKAKDLKLPFYKIVYSSIPRLSLPHLFIPLIKILEKIKVLKKEIKIENSLNLIIQLTQNFKIEVKIEKNFAKTLACKIYDHIPFVISSGKLEGVARRWKTQFNENAKNFSFFEILPEIKHNTIEGINFPDRGRDELFFLLLENNFDNEQNKKSFKILKDLLEKEGLRFETVFSQGQDLLSQKISLICLGDWVSFYLAILNQIDPSTTGNIRWFKEKLSK